MKLSQGGISGTVTDVRIVMKKAIENLASGIIVCHNHPSGNLNPSESDSRITNKIKEAGLLLDIQLLDHLIIIDKEINSVIGTYRLISSSYSGKFYSETEFYMDRIKNAPGIKLELGRACVDRRYRNGLAIALLWKGVSEYMKEINAKYLFGCSSISTTNIVEISLIYKYIKELHISTENFRVVPKQKYKVKELDYYQKAFDKFNINIDQIANFIPPLLKSYFKAGSVICGEPALDKKFKCADFFTVLEIDTLSKTYDKRYKLVNA